MLKRNFLPLILLLLTIASSVYGQSGLCTGETPFYEVDLVGNPGGTWISEPPTARAGSCCGSEWPERCIEFEIMLDSATVAINFEIASGAVPPGAMYYKLGCGPETPVGEPICVDGPGPHVLTFCKPGKNLNTYAITAIPAPGTSPDSKTSEGCNTKIGTVGLLTDVTWTDITGGGIYNDYLDCTFGCDTVTVTPQPGYPAYVDYQVCGTPASGPCSPITYYCDTIRVEFLEPLQDSIYPNPAQFCENSDGIEITGYINGGLAPYRYSWTDPNGVFVDSTQTILADIEGEYTVEIFDALYPNCPAKTVTGNVTMVLPPVVNAGGPISVCSSNPTVSLSVTEERTTEIQWFALGTFDDNKSLTPTYTPTDDQIAAGEAIVYVSGTGLGNCENAVDSVIITINPALTLDLVGDNLICQGTTQDLEINISGGTPGYDVLWDNGVTDTINPDLGIGTFSVTVSDQSANTCSETAEITVTEGPEIFTDLAPLTTILCVNTAAVTVTASGGTGSSYTYSWNTGETGQTITVSPGEFIVTVTDEAGCPKSDTTIVEATNSDLDFSFPTVPNVCFGTTADVTPIVSGGFDPVTYLWDDGSTDATKALAAGNYCLEVTDNLGCKVNKCITVNEDSLLVAQIYGPTVICKDSVHEITSWVAGGTPPYSYEWQDGSADANFSGVAGSYNVTVMDANPNNCQATASFTLNESTELTSSVTPSAITCPGAEDGILTVSASGSEGGYTYRWEDGTTSAANSGLDTGWHYVTITDQIGCSKIDSARLVNPDSILIDLTGIQNVTCFGLTDGAASVAATGGTGVYSYSWTSGETSENAAALDAGTNSVTVTDGNGCIMTESFEITEPEELTASAAEVFNLTCYQSNDGTFKVEANGGTRPYSYSWTPSVSSDSLGENLTAGSYRVEITDANGCSFTVNQTITEPTELTSNVTLNNNVLCHGESSGSATASISGGVTPYDYSWSDGLPSLTNTSLDTGWHYLTFRDYNNCPGTDSIYITQPDELLVLSSADGTIDCDSTTEIGTSASGGTSPYGFLWSTGATTDTTTIENSGSYLIAVTDANGCRTLDTVRIFPLSSTLEVVVDGPSHICFNTNTTLTSVVTPGIPPFTYEWEDGSTDPTLITDGGIHTVTVTDSVGCKFSASKEVIMDSELSISADQDSVCYGTSKPIWVNTTGGLAPYDILWSDGTTGSPANMEAGDYYIYVTDSTGCKDTTEVSIIQNGPYDLVIDQSRNVSCFGSDNGWARAEVLGGFAPFRYDWLDSPENDPERFGLTAGSYTLTVMDFIGCEDTLTITIEEPDAPLSVSIDDFNVSCYDEGDGSIAATPSGGYAPYTYLWWEPNSTEDRIENLSPGTYNLSVMDSGECVVNASITITQPDQLQGLTNVTNVDCYGATTGVGIGTVLGGTSPYDISWSNGVTDTNKVVDLLAGSYSMFVADANGCLDTVLFTVLQPDSLIIDIDTTNVNCFGEANGSLTATPSGGTPIYTYAWEGSAVIASELTSLTAGAYKVTVTDAKGCEATQTVEVTEPDELEITVLSKDPLCYNSNDGEIEIQTEGGVYPYYYTVGAASSSDSIFTDLAPSNYTVIATDANGCQDFELVVSIVAPDTFQISSVTKTNLLCKEICDGKIEINTTGTATYAIVPGDGYGTDPIFTSLCDGTYDVYAQNENGCTDSAKALTLTAPPLITFTNPSDTSICVDGTVTFDLEASGGSGALKYYVNGTDTNTTGIFSFSSIGDTTLNFQIVDENGCSPLSDIVAVVNVNDSLNVAAFEDMIICAQDTTNVFATTSGGDGNYNLSWSDGTTEISNEDTVRVYPLTTTTYEVTLTDDCETPPVTDEVTIEVLEYPDFTINQLANNYCTPAKVEYWLESDELDGYKIDWRFNGFRRSDEIRDSINFAYSGVYDLDLYLTSPQDCEFTFSEDSFIVIKPFPKADFTVDNNQKTIENPIFEFENISTNYTSIEWFIKDSRIENENFFAEKFDSVACYPISLVAHSDAGCSDTTTQQVCVEDIFAVAVPNAFTPGGDGINEGFIPVFKNIDESTFNFWVFDRWGEQIYHTQDPNEPWNGRRNNTMNEVQIDVYVWIFQATDSWGKKQREVGTVSIIR